MQTREKPPITVHPDVEHLMKGDMLQVRDLILDRATAVAETHEVEIEQVRVRELFCYGEDWSKVIFEICTSADEDTAMAYWEAVDNAVWNDRNKLSKSAETVLDEGVTIFVNW